MDNKERAEYERTIWKRQTEALERIAGALERLADQGDDIEQHLSTLASVGVKFRNAAITTDGELVVITVRG